jgi:cytoskeletal protein CcmA (bactofilin family)
VLPYYLIYKAYKNNERGERMMTSTMQQQDVKISGSGTISAGVYNDLKISGSGKVLGDVECEDIKVSGAAKFNGRIKSNRFDCSGSTKCLSDVEANKVSISGSSFVEGKLKCNNADISGSFKTKDDVLVERLKVSGSMKTEGLVKAETISISGSFSAKKGCECELFTVNGQLNMEGLLNAESIQITHSGFSFVPELGGETIEISLYSPRNFFRNLFSALFLGKVRFKTKSIEGSVIKIDHTDADVVRGDTVTIGKNCTIGLVEYTEDVQIHSSAKVKEYKRIEK